MLMIWDGTQVLLKHIPIWESECTPGKVLSSSHHCTLVHSFSGKSFISDVLGPSFSHVHLPGYVGTGVWGLPWVERGYEEDLCLQFSLLPLLIPNVVFLTWKHSSSVWAAMMVHQTSHVASWCSVSWALWSIKNKLCLPVHKPRCSLPSHVLFVSLKWGQQQKSLQ